MLKGYVVGWEERRDDVNPERTRVDVGFDSHPENAVSFRSRDEAERNKEILESLDIVMPSSEGGNHVCRGFEVEELSGSGEFVIAYKGPFVVLATHTGFVAEKG